jgi:hypothetical protein
MNVLTRFRPSPAMVIACIALTVALGGTSVAAINALPRNSVGTKQLKKNAVTGPKIKASAVTGVKVANNSLTGADVNEASLGQVPSAAHAASADTAAPSGAAGGDLAGSTYPNPTIAAGVVTPTKFGAIPQARLQKTAGQSIPGDETITTLAWDGAQYNVGGMFDATTPDRLVAPIAGVYAIDAGVRWAGNLTGYRFAAICLNAPTAGGCNATSDVAVSEYATNNNPGVGVVRLTQQTVSTQIKLAAGDVVQIAVAQNTGAGLAVDGLPATNFSMTWVGKG